MKTYWNKHDEKTILEGLKRKFKEEINNKIKELKELELDWRKSHMVILEQEEKIAKKEKELKEAMKKYPEILNPLEKIKDEKSKKGKKGKREKVEEK